MCKTDLDNPGVQRVVRSTRRSATMAKMQTIAREDRRAVRPPVRQGQSYRGKYVCEEPVWQDQRLATADELQTQVLTCLTVLHGAMRVFDETMDPTQITKTL